MTMSCVLGTGLGVARCEGAEVEYSDGLKISSQKLLLSLDIFRCQFQVAGSRGYRLSRRIVSEEILALGSSRCTERSSDRRKLLELHSIKNSCSKDPRKVSNIRGHGRKLA